MMEVNEKTLLLDVNNVGYEVLAPEDVRTSAQVGDNLSLYIYTHVREDQITLFGFQNKEAKSLFLLLISVSGIGPKTALELLGVSAGKLVSAISTEDFAFLTSCPGIGKKTAERLSLELKDKVAHLQNISTDPQSATNYSHAKILEENFSDIIVALEGLGYDKKYIVPVLSRFREENVGTTLSDEAIVTYCLQHL